MLRVSPQPVTNPPISAWFTKANTNALVYEPIIPAQFRRQYSAAQSAVSNYVGATAITNITAIQGPVAVSVYIAAVGGTGAKTLRIHPEIYYTYGTNASSLNTNVLLGDWSAAPQSIINGSTNRYDWIVSVPYTVSTGGTFTVFRTFRVDENTGNSVAIDLWGGTNTPSQISFNTAMSPIGQTIYASNIISGGTITGAAIPSIYVSNQTSQAITFTNNFTVQNGGADGSKVTVNTNGSMMVTNGATVGSATIITHTNVSASHMTATNGYRWGIRYVPNDAACQIWAGMYNHYTTNVNFTLADGIANLSDATSAWGNEGVLIITNKSGANITITMPTNGFGGGTYTITNVGVVSTFTIPGFMTNYAFRCLK